MKHHIRGDKFKLDNGVKPRAVSEDTILETGKTYTIPLFLYNHCTGVQLFMQEHIGVFHQGASHCSVQITGSNRELDVDIREWMNYDPYLGRIVHNHSAAQQNAENPPS